MEKSKIKTGIFGGSFNPIHMGHLALANYLCVYNGLDEIWFLVSPHNPLKQQTDLWDDNLRLELVKLAIADYPKFRASDFEFHTCPTVTIPIAMAIMYCSIAIAMIPTAKAIKPINGKE